jgi:acyl transferase domain-containing protein/acyl carrier protein
MSSDPSENPIAVIGIGCRFPGANDVEAFWRILRDGLETTENYSGGRLPYIDEAYRAGVGIATRRGGFLRHLDRFDAEFFGVAPREAALLDPQQRLLLEVAWEAVEDAGIPTTKVAGSATGVFVGLWTSDYEHCLDEQTGELDFYSTTGSGRYAASGRLGYFFDLRGPNLTIDTACSSSLVAIHLACQSLRNGESEMALAGGANVILRPEITRRYTEANMLSPDGRCKFGDAAADGYVRSEGAALVLLKPLSRAVADGDPIYAVIRGSAMNNDGRSSGSLVSPSREGHESLLRKAFADAEVDPSSMDYIEAHGTGTLVGDPIEIETIGRAVDAPGRRRPCLIGSVKTNIGHTESASGVAGLIKVALSLQRGAIPASLHLRNPNPAVAWNNLPVAVQTVTATWPHTEPVRLAGVSSFGITGTNAHVVLENFEAAPHSSGVGGANRLFVFSAHSAKALEGVAASWQERLQNDPAWPESLADLAYTAAVRRTHHEFRLAITATSRSELSDKLSRWLSGQDVEGVQAGRSQGLERSKAVFVFPGQGGQWAGMGRSLMCEPAFGDAMAKCDQAIQRHAGWSVIERLMAGREMPEDVNAVQPCLFAVMVSLAALWRSWGVEPQAVVGHSMGEIAAAAVSGALTLEDAAAVICYRSQLMKRASGCGLMAFTQLSLQDAEALARNYGGRISVAANNSAESSVLSGDADAIEDAIQQLTAREVFCRRIKVDVASHSSHMDPLRDELDTLLRHIRPQAGSMPIYSTTNGNIEDGLALDARYWSRNLRQPVLFASAVQSLLGDGFDTFIEVSSHPLLGQSIEGIRHSGKQAIAVASLQRDRNERAELLNSIGALYLAGFPVDFSKLYPAGACLRLPVYPFQRERHWIETVAASKQQPQIPADLYELRWFEADAPAVSTAADLWIILSGDRSVAQALTAGLQTWGREAICVSDIDQLESALETFGAHCHGVIRIACDAATEAFDGVRTVRACAGAPNPPRLWLITTGVLRLPSDTGEVCVAQSPAWGLGKVIECEHPELRCVNVDLSATPNGIEIETLARLVCHDGAEQQVAVRGGKFFVARYESVPVDDSAVPTFRSDAAYIITGGLGGIGLQVARWMVKHEARHLALVGRRSPDDAARVEIADLESMGAVVRVFSADMADDTQVAEVLRTIGAELPPLKGVFHLAAVIDSRLLKDLEEQRLERVMRSKAVAAATLDRHLGRTDLDFLVLFSSIAAAISQPGLASYAAANASVEALARNRRARGLKAQSIQWGSWLSTGFSADQQVQKGVLAYQEMGIQPLAAEHALRLLGKIMVTNGMDALALPVNWEQFARYFEKSAPPAAFERLLPKREVPPQATPESIRAKLLEIEPDRRRSDLEAHLRDGLGWVLKTDAARIDPAKTFASMGLDSLMALQFARGLAATTSLRVPATMIFNYPTIQKLAEEIAQRMEIPLERDEKPAFVGTPLQNSVVSTCAGLTDEQAIEALAGKGGETR